MAASIINSAHVLPSLHNLPVELIKYICVLAAEDDRHCAQALALVSRAVCQWTAKARWRVVVITSIPQYIAFWKAINAVPDSVYNLMMINLSKKCKMFASCADGLEMLPYKNKDWCWPQNYAKKRSVDLEHDQSVSRKKRRGITISYPLDGEPHEYIRHLFIDFQGVLEEGYMQYNLGLSYTLDLQNLLHGLNKHERYPFKQLCEPENFLKGELSQLEHLSLGVHAHIAVGINVTAKEVTWVYVKNDYSMESEDEDDGGQDYFKEYPRLFYDQDRMEKLHIIGVDARYPNKGMIVPWNTIASIQAEDKMSKVTHIRYDTAKSGFFPTLFPDRSRDYQPRDLFGEPYHLTQSWVLSQTDEDAQYLPIESEEKEANHIELVQFAWDPMSPATQLGKEPTNSGKLVKASIEEVEEEDDEMLAKRLQKEVTDLFGWDAPGIMSAMDFAKHKATLSKAESQLAKNCAYTSIELSSQVLGIEEGDDNSQIPTKQMVRAPRSMLHFGGKAALTREDRLALFLDRARGGKGAWPA